MPARPLSLLLAILALGAFAARGWVGLRELRASKLVRAIEVTSPAAAAAGAPGQALLRQNLALAQEAVRLDRSSLAAAQALGSVYLLLGRADEAAAAYQRALRLQPAAEIYMDLGHAFRAAGRPADARANYALARRLDTRLEAQVPADLR